MILFSLLIKYGEYAVPGMLNTQSIVAAQGLTNRKLLEKHFVVFAANTFDCFII